MQKKWDKGTGVLTDSHTENAKREHNRKNNVVGLGGELAEIARVKNICGLSFDGYTAKIETPRTSGTIDEITVAFTDADAVREKECGDLPLEAYFTPGVRLLITGCQQTLKDFKSGKVLVFVLADYVALCPNAMLQNDIALTGEIAFKPKLRVTQRGITITDIFVKTQNMLTSGICYIPCICWYEAAEKVAEWQPGDVVSLKGRIQSRKYKKQIETGGGIYTPLETREEIRTAYEISVHLIERTGGTGNVWIL